LKFCRCLVHVMSEHVEEEIRRLLSISFHELPDTGVTPEMLTRVWSLDFQWADSLDALRLLESLVRTGWLCLEGDLVRPIDDFAEISVPIGWTPILRRMIDGVDYVSSTEMMNKIPEPESNVSDSKEKIPNVIPEIDVLNDENRSVDPMLEKIQKIRTHISNASGLEVREIQRRAQRKRRSCMPMTLWMALLLVGREQRIDISSFL